MDSKDDSQNLPENSAEPVVPTTTQKKRGPGLDRAASLFMVVAAALMIGNVVVLWLASEYNNKACLDALYEAGKACIAGQDQRRVMRAAYLGLQHLPTGGFFIDTPHFTEYKCEQVQGGKKLTIQTSTSVRLPAPIFVVMSKDNVSDDGRLAIHKKYQLDIPNGSAN